MAKSICIVCGKEDGGIPWHLMPVHSECRAKVTCDKTYDEQVKEFEEGAK